MPITESSTMATTVIRSKDGYHRYLLSKVWDDTKPKALLVMLCAGSANVIAVDTTTMLVVKNLHQLDYGGVSICNLFTNSDKENDKENDRVILNAAKDTETLIFGWGTGSATNPAAQRRIAEVLELLKEYQANAFCLASPTGRSGLHPLAPALRESWILVPWLTNHVEAVDGKKAKVGSKRKDKVTA